MSRVVVAVAVELDRRPLLRPAAVDAPAARRSVRDWEREACLLQQGKETRLEPAQGHRNFTAKHSLERCSATRIRESAKDRIDLAGSGPVEDAGLMAGRGKCRLGQ